MRSKKKAMCEHRFFFQAFEPEVFEEEPELLFSLSSPLILLEEEVDSELPNRDDCEVVGEDAGVLDGMEGLLTAFFAGAALRAAFLGAAFLGADFFAAFFADFFTAFLGAFFAAFLAVFAPFFAAFFADFLPAFAEPYPHSINCLQL